jgi:hypothetical protein
MEAFLLPGINAENIEHFNHLKSSMVIEKKYSTRLILTGVSSTPELKVLHVIGL